MSRSAPGTRPTSATVVRPTSAVSRRRNDAADDSSVRPQTSFAAQHHASIVDMIRHKKQAHVDSYFTPTLEERSRLAAASSTTTHCRPPTAFRDASGGNPEDALLLHNWVCDPFGTTTGKISAPLKTPSIMQLMEESRRRKVGKMKTESLFLAELQYRERLQRSWLQQWWLMWCRAVEILLENAAKEVEVQAQLKQSVHVARRRRVSTRRDVARGLAQLNATAHLNERFQNWKVAAVRLRTLRRQKMKDAESAAASWNSFGASATSSKLPVTESDPHAGPSAGVSPNISPIKPKKGCEAPDDSDDKMREEATETSETPQVAKGRGTSGRNHSHEDATMQLGAGVVVHAPVLSPDIVVAPAEAPTASLFSTTSPRPHTPSYRGYKVEDAWSPSLGPPASRSQPPSTSGPIGAENPVRREADSDTAATTTTAEDSSEAIGATSSSTTQGFGSASATLRYQFDEALVQFAVQDYANELLNRHAAKLTKIAVKLEGHRRFEIESSHGSWNVLTGTRACFLAFQATATMLLLRFTNAAVEEMERLVRTRYWCDESSAMVDILVEFRVGLRELAASVGHADGIARPSSSMRPLAVVDDRRAALASAVRMTQRVLRGFGQRQKLQRIRAFWILERAVRNDAWTAFRQQLVLWSGQLARAIRETEDRVQQHRAVAVVQRVGRARQVRRRLGMLSSFWQADRAIRREALVSFRSRVRRFALEEAECRLVLQERLERADILDQERADWEVLQRGLAAASRVREVPQAVLICATAGPSTLLVLLQRVGRGFLARKPVRQHHEFWLVDAQVRRESFAVYVSKVRNIAALWEPRSNLAAAEAASRRLTLVEPERAAFEQLMNSFASAGFEVSVACHERRRHVVSTMLLQRVGRGALRRALMTRELQFWLVDASIRAEAFTAWQRESKKLTDRFRRSLRLLRSEAAARAAVVSEESDKRGSIESHAHEATASIPIRSADASVTERWALRIIQRCGRGFLSRKQLRRLADFWNVDRLIRCDAFAAWSRQTISIALTSKHDLLVLEESLIRAQLQGAENVEWSTTNANFEAQLTAAHPATDEATSPEKAVGGEERSQRSVSSESQRYASLTQDNRESSITTVDGDDDESEEVDVSSSDGGDAQPAKGAPQCGGDDDDGEEVDVSSSDDGDAPPPAKIVDQGGETHEDNDDDEEVDVSSDEESTVSRPSPVHKTTARSVVPAPQVAPMSMFYQNHPSDDDSEVTVSTDDDDDDGGPVHVAPLTQPQGVPPPQRSGTLDHMVSLIDLQENSARTVILDEQSAEWNAVLRRARAEQSALSSDDEADDDDEEDENAGGDGEAAVVIQLGGNSLEVEESGASPAKSDATHAPGGRAGSRLSNSGRSVVSSGVTPVAQNSRSLAGSDAVEVETVTSDSSDTVHVDSDSDVDDDDDDDDDTSDAQRRASIGAPRTSTVRDLYMKMFAEQRESVASKESAARQAIVHELDRLHQSLVAAEEYLVRHATVIYSRNRFAKSMLDAKRKLAEMVAMQHRRPAAGAAKGPPGAMEAHHGRRGHTRISSNDSVGSGVDLSPSFAIHQANTPYKRIFREPHQEEGASPSPQSVSPPQAPC